MKRLWMTVMIGACAWGLAAQDPNPPKDTRTLRPQQATVQADPQSSEQRIALVIGNGGYKDAPLKNPPSDARAMAQALAACGFKVSLMVDANRAEMFRAVREFGERIRGGGVGLFYYAGHGMQVKGSNYLIPVGVDINSEDEVPVQGLDVNAVLGKMDVARNRLNLLILDACRNNPFARSFRSANRGLTQMEAPSGTFLAFATAPGSTASDGNGENGLYTQYILKALQQPGLNVEQVFKQVRIGVKRDSRDQQVPWDSSSLTGDFYFHGGASSGPHFPILPMPSVTIPAPSPVSPDLVSGSMPPPALILTGNLQVSVLGTEAKVFLGPEFKGTTKPDQPLNLTGLPVGETRLRVEAPGYLTVYQSVRVAPGEWTQVGLPMKKGLKVIIYMKEHWVYGGYWYDVRVDGNSTSKVIAGTYTTFDIPEGTHTVSLKLISQYDQPISTPLQLEGGPNAVRIFKFAGSFNGGSLTEVDQTIWQDEQAHFKYRMVDEGQK